MPLEPRRLLQDNQIKIAMLPKQTEFTRRTPVLSRKQEEIDAKVHNRAVKEREVSRAEVFAYVSRRHESEIIIL